MLNLFDRYTQDAQDLHVSLIKSGYNHPTVVLEDDGFLPPTVISPYSYYMGDTSDKVSGRPKYFNQIDIPKYWEIKGSNSNAEIYNHDVKKANIYYAKPNHLRLVNRVDWFDGNGKVRICDHYNQYGRRYGQMIFNANEQKVMMTYFDQENREVIVENFVTGDIILNLEDKIHVFQSKYEFVQFYIENAEYNLDTVIYNSLAIPFLISHRLTATGQDILFWQERLDNGIPGNMEIILNSASHRTTKVVIPKRDVYDKALSLTTEAQQSKLVNLGYIYELNDIHEWCRNIVIFTNSDQLEQFEQIVTALPEYYFHVAAITEMSSKLMSYGQYDNVSLYPNVSTKLSFQLMREANIYLDINHGNEILDAGRGAFVHQLPILAFNNTLHQPDYTLPQNIFTPQNVDSMISTLKSIKEASSRVAMIQRQLMHANNATIDNYQTLLKEVGHDYDK